MPFLNMKNHILKIFAKFLTMYKGNRDFLLLKN